MEFSAKPRAHVGKRSRHTYKGECLHTWGKEIWIVLVVRPTTPAGKRSSSRKARAKTIVGSVTMKTDTCGWTREEKEDLLKSYLMVEKSIAEGSIDAVTLATRDGLLLHLTMAFELDYLFEYHVLNLRGKLVEPKEYYDMIADMVTLAGG